MYSICIQFVVLGSTLSNHDINVLALEWVKLVKLV